MEILIVVGVLVAPITVALVLVARRPWRREPSAQRAETVRDDTVRVGDDPGASPQEAARRAGNRNSWMIPSGF